MKILLAGQRRFGRDALELILRLGHELVAVVCPIRPDPDKLWIAAENHRLPIIQAGTLTSENMPGCDLIVCAHSHDFIGRKTRLRATIGAIGYHPSLLPLHRGRDAVEWALRMHEPITGGTVYWLNDTVDGGPIAAQDWCFIKEGDTARELWTRELAPMGIRLFERTILDIEAGLIVKIPQDVDLAKWEPSFEGAPRLHRPDLEMLGNASYRVIRERVEAQSPGAHRA